MRCLMKGGSQVLDNAAQKAFKADILGHVWSQRAIGANDVTNHWHQTCHSSGDTSTTTQAGPLITGTTVAK